MWCDTVVCFIFVECVRVIVSVVFFFQAEDGIRDLVRSRGLGDVYKRQGMYMRLAFAVAVCVDPDVLVIDEVLAVGDAAFQRLSLIHI